MEMLKQHSAKLEWVKQFSKEFLRQLAQAALICWLAVLIGVSMGYGLMKSDTIYNLVEDKFLIISFVDKPTD